MTNPSDAGSREQLAASIRAARRADPDGKLAAKRIRQKRRVRRERWLSKQNFEGLDMRTIVQCGSKRLVRLPQGAAANYAVLDSAKVLHTSDYTRDDDAWRSAKRFFPKGARLNLGEDGFVTSPSA